MSVLWPHAGGATALLALRLQHRLAGVLALSSYLPMRGGPDPVISPENAETPVLMLHGDADPTVRCHLCTPGNVLHARHGRAHHPLLMMLATSVTLGGCRCGTPLAR
jgi:hypothetical protein